MAKYPGTLESANINEFGIVYADQIQGHKTVTSLEALYAISDAILSKSKDNTGGDAIGQEWFVISEGCYYRLDNWDNRKQSSGWSKIEKPEDVKAEIDNYTVNGYKISENPVLGSGDIKTSDYALSGETGENLMVKTSDTIGGAFGKVQKQILDNKNEADQTFEKLKEELGFSETLEYTPGAENIQSATTVTEALDTLGNLVKSGDEETTRQLESLNSHGVDKIGDITTSPTSNTISFDTWKGADSPSNPGSIVLEEATGDNAGLLGASGKDQLDQIGKIGELTKVGSFSATEEKVSLGYKNVNTTPGATDEVSEGTIDLPVASRTSSGTLKAEDYDTIGQVQKLSKISHLKDEEAIANSDSSVTLHFDCISTNQGADSEISERTVYFPVASQTEAGIMTAADKVALDVTIPERISQETKDREEAIESLRGEISGNISTQISELQQNLQQEVTARENSVRSIAQELGFTEDPQNTYNFTPANTDLQDKETVTDALDFLADEKYRSELPDDLIVPNNFGGLSAGQTVADLKKKSISQILDDMIFPELQPTVVAPSCSISFKSGFSSNQILEVGAPAPDKDTNFTTGFSRGSSKVAGISDLFRAGELIEDDQTTIYYGGSVSNVSLPENVTLGTMQYNYQAHYGEGDTLLTSKGNKASVSPNPLPEGTVRSGAIYLYGTYPYLCNGASASNSSQDSSLPSSVTPETKLPLQKWTDTLIGAKFASEATTGTRLVFEFPSTKNVTKVEFMNTVSGKWEVFSGYTTEDAGNKEIQGNQIAYTRLTTTGSLIGAIQLRFTVANRQE